MANCSSCGAYIPDGQTVCPACGVDNAQPPKAPSVDLQDFDMKPAEKNKTSTSERTGETPTSEKPVSDKARTDSSKLFAILSYVSVLCFLPFIITPNDEFAKYHGKQGILLLIISAIIDLIGKLTGNVVYLILSLFRIYLLVMGIINAANGKMQPLPYVGQYAEKF